MENAQEARVDDYSDLCGHMATRPLKYVKDRDGYGWLCDNNTDPAGDLRTQGCWRCDEMAFPTGG